MRAYYYEFKETGVDAIDDILEQIAIAGKMYHHTDSWSDEDEDNESCISKIQAAANKAAEEIKARPATLDAEKTNNFLAMMTENNGKQLDKDPYARGFCAAVAYIQEAINSGKLGAGE